MKMTTFKFTACAVLAVVVSADTTLMAAANQPTVPNNTASAATSTTALVAPVADAADTPADAVVATPPALPANSDAPGSLGNLQNDDHKDIQWAQNFAQEHKELIADGMAVVQKLQAEPTALNADAGNGSSSTAAVREQMRERAQKLRGAVKEQVVAKDTDADTDADTQRALAAGAAAGSIPAGTYKGVGEKCVGFSTFFGCGGIKVTVDTDAVVHADNTVDIKVSTTGAPQPVDLDCENEPYTLVAGRVVLTNYPRTAASDPQNTCIVDGLPKTASLKSLTYDAAGSKVVMKVENESPIGVIDLTVDAKCGDCAAATSHRLM